ncbi:hypothetical protein C8A05DRAFT_19622 [Staphylotrichum tortipilum]|uniref:Uncharacterized protein n=1 Tax=Staphylotrichum tortipilum TaxID=2831512 RepID=A0AAN6RNI7_9PEZI|nr:hypothetical protein C8A05DRAFT_19622 [Staphylotrichum longicolle]
MPSAKKLIEGFLADINDDKLSNLGGGEHTIETDMNRGFRLDYQGRNDDPNEDPHVHRLYIQPVGSSKSKSKSKRNKEAQNNGSVLARCHASDNATPQEIRDALILSSRNEERLPNKTTQHPVEYAPPPGCKDEG